MVPCQAASTAFLKERSEDVQKNRMAEAFYRSCFVPCVHDAYYCPAENSLTDQMIKKDFGKLGNLISSMNETLKKGQLIAWFTYDKDLEKLKLMTTAPTMQPNSRRYEILLAYHVP